MKYQSITYKNIKSLLEEKGIIHIVTVLEGAHKGEKLLLPELTQSGILNAEQLKITEKNLGNLFFAETIATNAPLIICGAGHVSQALCHVASFIGFDCIIIDDRSEFAQKSRFPRAKKLLCEDFFSALAKINNPFSYYAIMTRGHKWDETCLEYILPKKHAYLGMMGSKIKKTHTWNNLLKKGFSQQQLDTIYAPIGLSIGGQTPEEIAISVTAELIKVRSQNDTHFANEEVFKTIEQQSSPAIMITIIQKSGSAPRGLGSRMVVGHDFMIGTIGGGSVEFAASEKAKTMLNPLYLQTPLSERNLHCSIENYDLSSAEAAGLGMVCGGRVKVLFEYL